MLGVGHTFGDIRPLRVAIAMFGDTVWGTLMFLVTELLNICFERAIIRAWII